MRVRVDVSGFPVWSHGLVGAWLERRLTRYASDPDKCAFFESTVIGQVSDKEFSSDRSRFFYRDDMPEGLYGVGFAVDNELMFEVAESESVPGLWEVYSLYRYKRQYFYGASFDPFMAAKFALMSVVDAYATESVAGFTRDEYRIRRDLLWDEPHGVVLRDVCVGDETRVGVFEFGEHEPYLFLDGGVYPLSGYEYVYGSWCPVLGFDVLNEKLKSWLPAENFVQVELVGR